MPIGARLRDRRIEVLGKGLREMALLLEISPAHLTDIEKGHRNPSDELLVKIAAAYGMPENDLRAAFHKPESEVKSLASTTATEVAMVPDLLRSTQGLTTEQYKQLMKIANKMKSGNSGKPD